MWSCSPGLGQQKYLLYWRLYIFKNRPIEMFRASQKPLQGEFFCTSYPLVDWVVQGGWRQRLEVELPHGHAGIHSVVVEYTVYCYVLPRSSHHFLGDVAHRCTQERRKKPRHFMLRLLPQRRNLVFNFLYFEKPFTKDTKPNGCHSDDKNKDSNKSNTWLILIHPQLPRRPLQKKKRQTFLWNYENFVKVCH